jgi:hypothetical protein
VETQDAKVLTFTGDPEPSSLQGEGVETRRAAPTALTRHGEGIVQTTDALAAAVKTEVVRRAARPVPVRFRPPAPFFQH